MRNENEKQKQKVKQKQSGERTVSPHSALFLFLRSLSPHSALHSPLSFLLLLPLSSFIPYIIGDQRLTVSADRTLYWENKKTLILADLHVGKTGHFRKAGIAVPGSIYKDDLHRLLAQILFFKAERVIIVGDLSHSIANRELDLFRKWRKDFSSLDVHLAKGNHDILDNKWYEEASITVHTEPMKEDEFVFVHDIRQPGFEIEAENFAFSGHVHPCVTIRGRGRQSLHFPCFYFEKKHCILPAFSKFTGGFRVYAEEAENLFAIVEKDLIPIESRFRL